MFKNPLLFPLKKVQKKVVKNERNPFLMTTGKTQFSVKNILILKTYFIFGAKIEMIFSKCIRA